MNRVLSLIGRDPVLNSSDAVIEMDGSDINITIELGRENKPVWTHKSIQLTYEQDAAMRYWLNEWIEEYAEATLAQEALGGKSLNDDPGDASSEAICSHDRS